MDLPRYYVLGHANLRRATDGRCRDRNVTPFKKRLHSPKRIQPSTLPFVGRLQGHYNDGYLPCVTTSRSLSVSVPFLHNNA